ncbi:hypothetical protein, partial [Ohtaekwangia sp.]|uniref:hypothetical protein n=1 Tax=Ohtaekwangia sp. TaxID=2066019 RepID=UPI002FDCD3FB
ISSYLEKQSPPFKCRHHAKLNYMYILSAIKFSILLRRYVGNDKAHGYHEKTSDRQYIFL